MLPFSRRYERDIFNKRIQVSLTSILRGRIIRCVNKHSQETRDDYGNWSDSARDSIPVLLGGYGKTRLEIKEIDSKKVREVGWEEFITETYPAQVFDFIEVFLQQLSPNDSEGCYRTLNDIFQEEGSPWFIHEGRFILVDSKFFEVELHRIADETLNLEPFKGAKEEYQRAREEYTRKNYKDAIFYAGKALESSLKSLMNDDDLNADKLIRKLNERGFYEGLPDSLAKAFGDNVLMALPFLRNRLGGHGQGKEVIHAPKSVASLALRMAATFIAFLQERAKEIHFLEKEGEKAPTKKEPDFTDDDIPF